MQIAINTLGPSKLKAGIGRYVSNLVNDLAKIDDKNKYFIFVNEDNFEWFANITNSNFKIIKLSNYSKIKFMRVLWEQFILPLYCVTKKIDLLHSPGFTLPFIKTCKQAVTIHDMTFFNYPEHHTFLKRIYFPMMIKHAAKRADLIFADSENTKQDIIKILKVKPDEIQTVHLGVEDIFFEKRNEKETKRILSKYNINKKYLLFVGTIEPRKNIATLISAFAKLPREDLDLVICGKLGWMYDEIFSLIKKEGISEQVKLLGFVPDEDLPSLYANSEVFVYPSFYEGFGLPVIEAMASGCPVITSNLSSTKEIAGESAMLIDPNDQEELIQAIKNLLANDKMRQNLIKKGRLRAKEFTTLATAEKTLRAYQSMYEA